VVTRASSTFSRTDRQVSNLIKLWLPQLASVWFQIHDFVYTSMYYNLHSVLYQSGP
jgi:hypothetical protein